MDVTGSRPRADGEAGAQAAQDFGPFDLRLLHRPGPGEVSLMTTGDTIMYRPLDGLRGPGYEALFHTQRSLCDVAFTNCELVFSRSGYPVTTKSDIARAPPEVADGFAWQGIDLVSVANNHTMDLGEGALRETLEVLDTRGIAHAGAGEDLAAATRPAIVERNGVQIGLLAFYARPSVTPGWAAEPDTPGVATIWGDPIRLPATNGGFMRMHAPREAMLRTMEDAIDDARRQVDFLLVSFHMHWGVDPRLDARGRLVRVDEGRRIVTRAAIDHGADLVVAHGPHEIDPVEVHRGRFIFHSLGNFVFHIFDGDRPSAEFGPFPGTAKSIYAFTIRPQVWDALAPRFVVGQDGVRSVQVLPLRIDRDGNPRFPEPAIGRQILEDFRTMSEGGGARFEIADWHAELHVE